VTHYLPGDPEYRAYVGPFEQYDVMGATQFALLYSLGIRQQHRLLDVGCGSLRAGRLFITYLEPGNYAGIEPNAWLIEDAIKHQVGQDLISIKFPTFTDSDSFEVTGLGQFDFVVAQSIASHAGPELVPKLLSAVKAALLPSGLAAVTFIHADPEDRQVVHIEPGDAQWPKWLYPDCFSYRRPVVESFVAEAGLVGTPIPWFHPRQTWWLLAHRESVLPGNYVLSQLRGLTLADGFEGSWIIEQPLPPSQGVEPAIDPLRVAYNRIPEGVRKRARIILDPVVRRIAKT
jgi:SAM-dependent methyltransferase